MNRSPYQHLNATERAMIRLLDEDNHSMGDAVSCRTSERRPCRSDSATGRQQGKA